MQPNHFGRRNAEGSGLAQTCEHDFIIAEAPVFIGTEGARSCARCDRVDVLMTGRWVAFEHYLESRRTEAAE